MDEFEIKAIAIDGQEKIWTRNKLSVSINIAISAIEKLGYVYASVVNTHGGNRSDVLFYKHKREN